MDKHKKPSEKSSESEAVSNPELAALYRRLQSELQRPKPSPQALTAALESVQRLDAEMDTEQVAQHAQDIAKDIADSSPAAVCGVCGHPNRGNNKFCGACGTAMGATAADAPAAAQAERRPRPIALGPNPFLDPEPQLEPGPQPERMPSRSGQETHHFHHHYHHHFFQGAQEGMVPRGAASEPRADFEKMRPTAALRGEMSRAEAGVRRITQEWALACNTKHLDDLLDLYVADAMVLRSNYPPVRGAAAVREFFYGALDAGLGEVELEPLRVEVIGDLAYEAGRCKALVPGATGKRREERGKYLWVCSRQSNGEWKLAADCWSSDLSLTVLESDVPQGLAVKSSQPRKP